MSEPIKGLKNNLIKWKATFDSNGLKVNLGKTKVVASDGIAQDGLSKSKVDPCVVCSSKVKANPGLCVHCDK